jgi:pimeloyl-ACP methyl ester carboxylesterase
VQAVVVATARLRPARYVAPFRHRWASRSWYRRALFRPWFVADAVALTERATHGLLAAHRDHADTMTAGRAMIADDPRQVLPELSCPVLVLWGARDAQLLVDDAFEYARRLRAPLRTVADCGHLVIVERPLAFLDALEQVAA